MARPIADKAWFARNRETNFRLRDALPGEVDEIAAAMLPAGTPPADGAWQSPPGFTTRVLAIRLPLGKVARMLTYANDPAPAGLAVMAVALGDRLALD